MDIVASAAVPVTKEGDYKVIFTDKNTNGLNSYTVNIGQDPSIIQDQFVIPVGNQSVVNVSSDLSDLQAMIDFSVSTECAQLNATACSGIINDPTQKIHALISSRSDIAYIFYLDKSVIQNRII